MADTLATLTAVDALARFREGSLSPGALVEDCLARIERDNPRVNAFSCVNGEQARQLAAESTRAGSPGRPAGRWTGFP